MLREITMDVLLAGAGKVAVAALAGGIAYGALTTTLDSKASSERVSVLETRMETIQPSLDRIEKKVDKLDEKLDKKQDKP